MKHRANRRGFAILIAIAMLALVSAAVVVMTRQFAGEMTRTRLSATDAQLRELLLAGARDAVNRAREWPQQPAASQWQIELPQPLKDQGAILSVQSLPLSATTIDLLIDARIGDRKSGQLLHFARSPDGWTVAGAELGK